MQIERSKTIDLTEPWQGVMSITLNFTDIDGNEIKALSAAFTELYKDVVPLLQLDFRFLELVAARAAHVNPRDLGTMWGADYMEVLTAARNFLLKSDSTLTKQPEKT